MKVLSVANHVGWCEFVGIDVESVVHLPELALVAGTEDSFRGPFRIGVKVQSGCAAGGLGSSSSNQ